MTMPRQPSFRARVMWLATGMGLLMSLVFALAAVLIIERYEHVLVGALLQDQADAWAQRLAEDPTARLPSSGLQHAHLRPIGARGNIPPYLANLPPGVHEASGVRDGVHIGVFDTRAGRVYLEIDLREIEALERYLLHILLTVIAVGALLSTLLGWWLARSATRPLRRLAGAVEQLGTSPRATQLAASQPRDELGRVALAIDGYQSRLVEAERSEQAFFADASHELRTPIAVMRGALELLEEDAQSQPRLQGPMQRLRRGVDEVSLLLDALLRLARRQLAELEPVDADAWLRQLLATTAQARTPPVRLVIEGQAGIVSLPLRDAELVLTALLRSLLARHGGGTLHARLSASGIALRFRADNAATTAPSRPHALANQRSDRALGSSLIGRLAAAHGWRIDDSRVDDDRLDIRWD